MRAPALMVAALLLSSCSNGSADNPTASPSRAAPASPVSTTAAAPDSDPRPETLQVVTSGVLADIPLAASSTSYVIGSQVVGADGSVTQLRVLPGTDAYLAAVELGGGWLVTRERSSMDDNLGGRAGDAVIEVFDDAGRSLSLHVGSARLAVSADGGQVAWWERRDRANGLLHVQPTRRGGAGTDQGRVLATSSGTVDPLRVLVDERVAVSVGEGRAAVLPGLELLRGLRYLRDVGPSGEVAGDRSGAPAGEYGAVVDGSTGDVIWSSDRWGVFGFSADGRFVVGQASATGGDASAVAGLDAGTGEQVVVCDLLEPSRSIGFDPTTARVNGDGTVDITASASSRRGRVTTILRCSADGELTRLSPVIVAVVDGPSDRLALVQP